MNINFLNAQGQIEHAWTTSWGVSTRLIGGLIMTHSDDDGLVLPPKIAPLHIIILPIQHQDSQQQAINEYCQQLAEQISQLSYHQGKIKVSVDNRDIAGGAKSWSWVKKGVPLRLTIGNTETTNDTVTLSRRDLPYTSKISQPRMQFITELTRLLDEIQQSLQEKAQKLQLTNTHYISSKADFYDFFAEPTGGFALAHWNGDIKVAQQIQQDLKASIRCIPLAEQTPWVTGPGKCLMTGTASQQAVIFAQSY
jgi:prolyl-tRNA synthetase